MGRIITESEALRIAQQYGLENEVADCIHKQFMDPWDALYEWDLLTVFIARLHMRIYFLLTATIDGLTTLSFSL